jgi:hypothetical protein
MPVMLGGETSSPQILAIEPCRLGATWKNVYIMMWQGRATPDAVRASVQEMRDCAQANPEGMGIVCSLITGLKVLGNEERKIASASYEELGKFIRGFGYIMEGTGFWAATQLGVMATINALTRPGFPMKTFGNPDELSSWMAPLLPSVEGNSVTGADLAAAVRSAREKLPPGE